MAASPRSNEWADFFSLVNGAALSRYPSLLQTWFPAGQISGREYETGNVNGSPGKSLKINIHTGVWKDFASDDGGSDPVSLYAAINHVGQGDAGLRLGRELGIEPPKPKRAADNAWRPITPLPNTDRPTRLPAGRPVGAAGDAWLYMDAEGRPLMWRVRFDMPGGGKEVLPLTWCENRDNGAREWRWKDLPAPRPLYNLEKIGVDPDARILIVEGEKSCDAGEALLDAGWTVVTWAGGAKRAGKKDTDWAPLKGRKVWIWPDNDDPGKAAALTIAEILGENALIIKPDPTWAEGFDIADLKWDRERTLEFIEKNAVAADAEPLKLKRIPVDLSVQDLDIQTKAIWEAVGICNDPPSLLTSPFGLVVVDRNLFGGARQRIADEGLLRNWLVTRIAFTKIIAHGFQVSTYPSGELLTNVIVGAHPVPRLTRMTEVPIFAEDGRLIAKEGFDKESGTYYLPAPGLESLYIPETPNVAQVRTALESFVDLTWDFPFLEKDGCDRTHAITFAMLPIVRAMIKGPTPLFRFEAPSPGTGKSMLMRILAGLTSVRITEISPGKDDDEWRKRITSGLAEDPDAFLIDNAQRLESVHLKKLLTDDFWTDRVLGQSKDHRFAVRALFGVSLNNPLLSREMVRRSLRIRLDAKCEHPEQRGGWRHKWIKEYAAEHRAELVEALVTLARYGIQHGDAEDEDATALGGYEAFSRRMSAVMGALGLKGFLGDRQDESMLSDEETAAHEFVTTWAEKYGTSEVPTKFLLDIAEGVRGFWLGRGDSDKSKLTVLGIWLKRYRERVFDGWQIPKHEKTEKGKVWALIKVSDVSES